jgi:hypothetical protein
MLAQARTGIAPPDTSPAHSTQYHGRHRAAVFFGFPDGEAHPH